MRIALQVQLALMGAAAVVIGLMHIAIGPSCIPGSITVNATLDSEDRFYATLFVAYGVAMLSCIKEVERKRESVLLLALVFFAAGVTRIVSMVAVGLPHPFFIAMTPLELTSPLLLAWLATRVARAAA